MPKIKAAAEREVVYPEVKTRICVGEHAITAAVAKEWLGWEEIPEGAGKSAQPVLTDLAGKPVRFLHAMQNRPFKESWCKSLAQDVLKKNQRFNGENVILGKYGSVLSAVHRMAAVVLANQMWEADEHWRTNWPTPPVWESSVIYGIDESSDVVRTLDNTMPRDLTDVLMTSGYFPRSSPKDREQLADYLAYSVRVLWHRAGRDANAYAKYRTNSECLAFIEGHGKLVDCVKHVVEENGTKEAEQDADGKPKKAAKGGIRHYCGLGTAAGLLYLMGSSASDPTKYRAKLAEGEAATEKLLKWDHWKVAQEFWTELAKKKRGKLAEVYAYRRANKDEDDKDPHASYVFESGTSLERQIVLCRAWQLWLEAGKVKAGDLNLAYVKDDEGEWVIKEPMPRLGGIDLGDPDDAEDNDPPVSEEEAEAEQEEVDAEREEREAKRLEERAKTQKEAKAELDRKKASGNLEEQLDALREEHGGAMIMLRRGGNYALFGEDATVASSALKLTLKLALGTQMVEVPVAKAEEVRAKLVKEGYKAALVTLPSLNGAAKKPAKATKK